MTLTTVPSFAQENIPQISMRECLSFRLGTVHYGINLLEVQEIRSYTKPKRIANAPKELLGVINLRGVLVPIIDLRIKLQCETAAYNGATVVIILKLRSKVIGAVVDSVSDVVQLEPGCIQPPPAVQSNGDTSFITGLATVGERMLILMDTESFVGDFAPGATGPTVH
ncbi:chemotaxis protein CheW [Rhodoferax sp. WC2427]|uniref:chemotaxis protein CheW n=1 Tax=Rhodoferax sp. WC2427 TaxID=3234144 RepID=UPI003467B759